MIVLTKEHDTTWNYVYSEYQNGQKIQEYSFKEIQELRKTHIIIII